MTADHFYGLLAKKLSGEANIEELSMLDELMESQPEWKRSAEIFSSLWQQSFPSDNTDDQELFEWHMQRMQKAGVNVEAIPYNKHRRINRSLKLLLVSATTIAAAFALFLVSKNFVFGNHPTIKETAQAHTEVKTRPASRTQMQLPDGSTVWLNASSILTYSKDFGKDFREVNLSGEAFFDVVKDAAHPFIIHTKVVDVKVVGTAFDVKAYPEDKITETSLIRGIVELTVKNKDHDKYTLKPNEKIVVLNDVLKEEPTVKVQEQAKLAIAPQKLNYSLDSTVIETSWVENKLIFQQKETFREVASRMERWFGVHITFANEEVANLVPFGSFTNETITQALDRLKEIIKFNYKMSGNEIIISP